MPFAKKLRIDVSMYKNDFPLLKGRSFIYLDSAATTHKPGRVIDALSHFYSEEYATVHRAIYDLSLKATEKYEGTRKLVKEFIGARYEEEIIFTKGTTESINLVASSFIQEGDEVLISTMEHHSNIVPWQLKKANLQVVPIDDKGEIIMSEFKKKISSRTKLVSIAHIANSTGTINPIEEIIAIAHSHGAKVLIDGAQAAAHLLLDMQKLDADFYCFSGHKMYGPTGIGILYGKRELLDLMPPYQGGGDMVDKVTFEKTTYQPLPLKFEAGTPLIAEVIALGAAIRYLQSVDVKNNLLKVATEELLKIDGLKIIGTALKKGPIITFSVEGCHPLDLATLLSSKNICIRTGHLCAQPTMQHFGIKSAARASFGIYNTMDDVEIFVASLKQVISTLR